MQGGICWEQGQIMLKYANIYAQNMRNPTRYLITHALFVTKYDDIFDQEEVLIILSTLKATF